MVSLVQHYVASCAADTRSDSPDLATTQALPTPKEDAPGDPALPATAVHLKLVQPFVRKSSTRSLQHLCRLVINRLVADVDCLPLPRRMADYLRQYTPSSSDPAKQPPSLTQPDPGGDTGSSWTWAPTIPPPVILVPHASGSWTRKGLQEQGWG